ncbi:MAG: sigma-70 family RNA polymerase sigma factor [Paludisphaera borealis]|uniref:sigma-70 family RNA polymerase sigma factor n=1 Tax=Paludisphaera borealis TaxID=1387353 RepID=UPI0028509681|nr:sigma-70 family RNA polymerase sigma factor [Paludisphaera borealis]MDR3618627.1 sigma-70 family RNA polymerase sigma factor [Paludisphaera borealis]
MMTRFQTTPFARDLQTLCRLGVVGGVGDGELLARFVAGAGDDRELAFWALIDRHGSMVLRVCLGVLKDRHDAEDAAQAAFLILARRARSIRSPGSLGSWLHGVAIRTASRARAGAARRRDVERKAGEEVAMREQVENRFAHDEELHEEIDRLPARYKAAVVACDLEGLTHAQAAARFHLPIRTLETRLYRGRDRLRARLVRRGVGLAAVEAALALSKPAEAALSASWKEATAHAAVSILEGASPVASGLVAERVYSWSQSLASGKIGSLAVSAVALLVSSGLLVGGAALASRKPDAPADEPPPVAQAPAQPDRKEDAPIPIVVPLPKPHEIKQILREAAEAAIRLSREQPNPGSSALLMISTTQMTAGDRDGALKTLRAAEAETNGRKIENPYPSWPCKIAGHLNRMGLREEAFRTLQQAAREVPDASTNPNEDYNSASKLVEIVQTQLRVGDAAHARENVKRIAKIAAGALDGKAGERGGILLRVLACAQTAVGDIDGAFATLDRATKRGSHAAENRNLILPIIAQEAKGLDPRQARRVVDRLTKEIEDSKAPEAKWPIQHSLVGLLARLGEVAEARRLAREVATAQGGGADAVARRECGLLESMAYAQREAGDIAGARESYRLAFEAIRGQAKTMDGANNCRQLAVRQVGEGDLEGALRSVEAIDDPGQEKSIVYLLLASKLAVEGETDRALEFLRKAREDVESKWKELPADRSKAVAFDPSKGLFAMMQMSAVQALAGEIEPALATARLIPDGVWRREALVGVVQSRALAGDLRESLKLALGFDSPDDRRLALEHLALGLGSRLLVEERLKAPAGVRPKEAR